MSCKSSYFRAFKIKGVGDIVTGRVEQGVLTPGVNVKFLPSNATGKVFSIEMHHKQYQEVFPGDNVGINIKGLDKNNYPKAGDVMVVAGDKKEKFTPGIVEEFRAVVAVQEHPGELHCTHNDKGGFTPSVHVRTGKAPCQMHKIHWKMGKSTGGSKVEDALFLKRGDQAEVTFRPKLPFFVEKYEDCEGLGRIACMDSNTLVMLGKVIDIKVNF